MAPRSAEAMQAAVLATGLLRAGADRGPLLLMCSPGRDSTCLLHIAVRELGPAGVRVLHVDHGLRPESEAEAQAVREAAEALGVAVRVRRAGPPPERGNLHAWAREERARLAAEEVRASGAGAVATAHTRSDLVETALFRLATQPGRRALLGLREREPGAAGGRGGVGDGAAGDGGAAGGLAAVGDDAAGHGGVDRVRPLLVLGRDETLAWCKAHGLRWVDDPSNADRRYARSRLRSSVTPVLRGLNPRFEEAVVRTLGELAEEQEALAALVEQVLPPGADAVDVSALAALPLPVARLVVRELCERAVGVPVPRATARTGELLARATADPAPFALDVGDGARLAVRRGTVRCEASTGPAAPR